MIAACRSYVVLQNRPGRAQETRLNSNCFDVDCLAERDREVLRGRHLFVYNDSAASMQRGEQHDPRPCRAPVTNVAERHQCHHRGTVAQRPGQVRGRQGDRGRIRRSLHGYLDALSLQLRLHPENPVRGRRSRRRSGDYTDPGHDRLGGPGAAPSACCA